MFIVGGEELFQRFQILHFLIARALSRCGFGNIENNKLQSF